MYPQAWNFTIGVAILVANKKQHQNIVRKLCLKIMPAQGVYREEICWVLGIYNCGYNTNETLVPYWSHLYFHFWNISWHHLFKLWVFYCCKLVDFWINILHYLQFCPIHWIAHEPYRLYKNMVNISRNHWISKFKQEFFYQNRVHQFKYILMYLFLRILNCCKVFFW